MNTIFALSMVAGVGLTTGTPVIGARVAEEMWAAGRADTARSRTCEVAYQTARRAVPAPSYLNRKKTAAGERPAKKKKGREYDRGDRREAIRMYLAMLVVLLVPLRVLVLLFLLPRVLLGGRPALFAVASFSALSSNTISIAATTVVESRSLHSSKCHSCSGSFSSIIPMILPASLGSVTASMTRGYSRCDKICRDKIGQSLRRAGSHPSTSIGVTVCGHTPPPWISAVVVVYLSQVSSSLYKFKFPPIHPSLKI